MTIEDLYFEHLITIVGCDKDKRLRRICAFLHAHEFIVLDICPMDANRAADGLSIRNNFLLDNGVDGHIDKPCSVLEMLVALAVRFEKDLAFDQEYGDRTGQWFRQMIVNIGFHADFEEEEGEMLLRRFLTHQYKQNGEGSIFTLYARGANLLDKDLWWQAMQFYNEKYAP